MVIDRLGLAHLRGRGVGGEGGTRNLHSECQKGPKNSTAKLLIVCLRIKWPGATLLEFHFNKICNE